jgi:hypothetical protein
LHKVKKNTIFIEEEGVGTYRVEVVEVHRDQHQGNLVEAINKKKRKMRTRNPVVIV